VSIHSLGLAGYAILTVFLAFFSVHFLHLVHGAN
jgi:hypothetical protein